MGEFLEWIFLNIGNSAPVGEIIAYIFPNIQNFIHMGEITEWIYNTCILDALFMHYTFILYRVQLWIRFKFGYVYMGKDGLNCKVSMD